MKRIILACALALTSTPAFSWTENITPHQCFHHVDINPYFVTMRCTIPHTLTIKYSGEEGGLVVTYAGQTATIDAENPEHTWDVWVMADDGMEDYNRIYTPSTADSIYNARSRRLQIEFLDGFTHHDDISFDLEHDINRPKPNPDDIDEDNPVIVFESASDFR